MDVLERIEKGESSVYVTQSYIEIDASNEEIEEAMKQDDVDRVELLRLAKLGKQMQWVGVAHKPPKINEHVIVFHEDDCKIAYISTSRNWRSSDDGSGLYGTIKYWMPLPPNPGEGE
jgi:hypothetical protein